MKILSFLPFILIIGFSGCISHTPHSELSQSINGYPSAGASHLFSIPPGAELLESTEFKSDGVPYLIERRYRLPSGEIFFAYWDVDGSHSVTIQRIEEAPLLVVGTDVNIPGMPGFREFNFGEDRRRLVQFMKLFRLGVPETDWRGTIRSVRTPSLSDRTFRPTPWRDEFILLLDLLDETWVLEHKRWTDSSRGSSLSGVATTRIVRVDEFDD
ncbi:MAG: hypothetical protein FWG66_06355 [Spirochaetes bacterium]|nr:hypothetical protein [Spirochaetota bacterium]